jgi:hypothetical protein
MPPDRRIPFPNPNAGGQRTTAASLFLEGRVFEASTMLSSAILQGESAALWNDWGVAQLGVPKRAVDAFLAIYAKTIEVLESGYQIWLRKRID